MLTVTNHDRWQLYAIAIILCISLTGCSTPRTSRTIAWASYAHVDTTNLIDLEELEQEHASRADEDDDEGTNDINPIRLQGLKETALTVGAQGALAKRSSELNLLLEQNHKYLDQSFNFYALILDQDVLPPVLVEGRNTMNLDNNDTIRIADQTYQIVQQARFVTAPPNWRTYLWLNFPKPDVPDPTLLPKPDSAQEINTWKKYVHEGWDEGVSQANGIFAENLARLKRDYQGMALYRKLLSEKMISPPVVAKTDLGITGGGSELTVNDRFKRITAHPSLNPNSQEWQPAVAQPFTSVAPAQLGAMQPREIVPSMQVDDELIEGPLK